MPEGLSNGQPEGVVSDGQRLLSVNAAAQRLGVSQSTLRRRVASGELPSVRIGHSPCAPVRIVAQDLVDFVVSSTVRDD